LYKYVQNNKVSSVIIYINVNIFKIVAEKRFDIFKTAYMHNHDIIAEI